MATVEIKNLTKKFGKVVAVDKLDLKVEDEEFIVFLGPSGCGKTTTLRCIAGLERPTEGEIYFDEQNVTHLRPSQRDVAMVFQFYALYPHLTAYENISFPLRTQRLSKREINKRIEKIVEILKIRSILKKRAARLDNADQQRVALARAIVRTPKVLLLDEPLSALDEKFREEMRSELRHIQREVNVTTVYVTHDQREAMALADRIVVMREGKSIQVGTPKELYEDPADLFVGHFLGSPGMNFIECKVERGNLVLGKEKKISYPLKAGEELKEHEGKELILGIRPEYVEFSQESSSEFPLKIKLFAREELGSYTILSFHIADKIFKAKVRQEVLPEKRTLYLRFSRGRICLFDKSTGKNIGKI